MMMMVIEVLGKVMVMKMVLMNVMMMMTTAVLLVVKSVLTPQPPRPTN